MNTFVEHPVLKDLSFDLMKNPSVEGIKSFLRSKRKKRQLFGLGYGLIGLIMFLFTLSIIEQGLSQYLILFVWISTMFQAGLLFKTSKKYDLSEDEIEKQIKLSKSGKSS